MFYFWERALDHFYTMTRSTLDESNLAARLSWIIIKWWILSAFRWKIFNFIGCFIFFVCFVALLKYSKVLKLQIHVNFAINGKRKNVFQNEYTSIRDIKDSNLSMTPRCETMVIVGDRSASSVWTSKIEWMSSTGKLGTS